jgi:hypothetical protein
MRLPRRESEKACTRNGDEGEDDDDDDDEEGEEESPMAAKHVAGRAQRPPATFSDRIRDIAVAFRPSDGE